MIEAGTVLQNRYRIDKKIGQGGMGAVFVATDERFGSTVAIKETFFTDESYRRAFEREARLLNNLRHSALPRVSDHFVEGNGQFLVMEYIPGDDLSEKIEETNTPFPIRDVLNWADQLLDALDFLHTQESPVIHRDIKPQNLKLTARGQIILLDFGLAKGATTDAKHKTAAQSVFGYSRSYASLEQIQGTGTDPRSDLYSLGATLYHLLTGIPPVDALTRAMTVLNGDADSLPSADKLHRQVTPEVAEILSRAMALNANHRPSSAMAMQAMLAEAAQDVVDGPELVSVSKLSGADLLTQKTEVFEATAPSRDTQQGIAQTKIMPLAASSGATPANKTQTELSKISTSENDEENSVVTKFASVKPDTEVQSFAALPGAKPSNRGKALGAALGGLLLIGSAAGAWYVFKPNVFQPTNSDGKTVIEKQESPVANNQNLSSETANSTASNSSALSPSGKPPINTVITKKENSPKAGKTPIADSSADDNGDDNSDDETPTTPSTRRTTARNSDNSDNSDDSDDNGDRVKMKNGKLETKDVIIDNGRVILKNGKDRITIPENIEGLPPAERAKVIKAIQLRNKQLQMRDKELQKIKPPIPPNQ